MSELVRSFTKLDDFRNRFIPVFLSRPHNWKWIYDTRKHAKEYTHRERRSATQEGVAGAPGDTGQSSAERGEGTSDER